jgi:ankyrin repeat protein
MAYHARDLVRRWFGVPAVLLAGWLAAAAALHAAGDIDAQLIEAAKRGQPATVRSLLGQHGNANAREVDGTTALHWAVRADDPATVLALVKGGADVSATNRYGVTPLALAAVNGNETIIEALLKAGADPNTASPEGETVLMTAARTGRTTAIRALLDRGAAVNAREQSFGETALMWAVAEDHAEVVAMLIDAGAEIDARTRTLEFAKFRFNLATMVNTVLPRGALTPLMFAARQGALASARVLVERGAALDLTDPDHTSAMVTAIINGHYDVAALLAEQGANPNVADDAGMAAVYALVDMHTQPLMINRPTRKPSGAVENLALLKLLLARGADPGAVLRTPLLARYHNVGDTQLGAGATPLMRAAKARDVPAMRLLLDAGADPNARAASGATALMFAATPVRAVPGTPAPPDAAALEAVRLCLDRGAEINSVNANGQTALHFAAQAGETDSVVALLVSRGADRTLRDRQGRTPFGARP